MLPIRNLKEIGPELRSLMREFFRGVKSLDKFQLLVLSTLILLLYVISKDISVLRDRYVHKDFYRFIRSNQEILNKLDRGLVDLIKETKAIAADVSLFHNGEPGADFVFLKETSITNVIASGEYNKLGIVISNRFQSISLYLDKQLLFGLLGSGHYTYSPKTYNSRDRALNTLGIQTVKAILLSDTRGNPVGRVNLYFTDEQPSGVSDSTLSIVQEMGGLFRR